MITVPVLCFAGYTIKKTKVIPERFIPIALSAIGIIFAVTWALSQPMDNIFPAVFTAITQGVLSAASAVYVHQLIKQGGRR